MAATATMTGAQFDALPYEVGGAGNSSKGAWLPCPAQRWNISLWFRGFCLP